MKTPKHRTYLRKCGICGEYHKQSEMVRDHQSQTGWVCVECHSNLHPEYDIEEW